MQGREGQRLGNYRLVRALGKGAFAQVYLGEHLYLKNYAAIKVLLASLTEEDEQLFLSEAQMIAQLAHPNIVHVRDFAIEHGTPFLAMDYASGGTLRNRHPQRSCLPLDLTISYVKQIAAALQHAHNHGIVHRDVKPENVLQGSEQLLLLSDFGISLHLPSADASNSQAWAGTLPYMAPEQMEGKAVYASDQYSLAIMTYEWLCGVRPFEGNALSLGYQHAQVPPPPLRSHDPSLPEAMDNVLQKALAKDPQERYTSVITFARMLERACQENTPHQVEGSRTDAPDALAHPRSQHIFLSHTTTEEISSLITDLRTRSLVVTDFNEVEPSAKNYVNASQDEEGIRQAIRATEIVLLVISPETRSSAEVQEHLRISSIYRRPILGLWIAGERIEELLPTGLAIADLIDARGLRYKHALDEIMVLIERHRSGAVEQEPVVLDFEPRNPYKGLQPFARTDHGDFFGREALVREMVNRLQGLLQPVAAGSSASRMLTIVGPSGSGKSSSVMAGLLPRLLEGAIAGSENWVYPDPLLPGKHPLDGLAQSIAACVPDKDIQTIRELLGREDGFGLHQLALSISRTGTRIVLLVDQLEELFSTDVAEAERQQFIKLLVIAATEPQGSVVVLLTLRADFYDRPFVYPDLGRLIQQNRCAVLPMEIEDLRAIIERPALLPDVRLVFERDLVGDLLYEIRNQAGTLPLLEFTLRQLFEHRRGHYLTRHAYQEIGGVRGALAKHAEQTYTGLPSDEHRRLAYVLFTRLLQAGEAGQEPLRRRAERAEFILEHAEQTQILSQTIDAFLAARLLTATATDGTTTLEVSHEALLREWPRLVEWIRESGTDIRLQQSMSSDVAQWEQRGRPKDRLYSGTQLKELLAWSQRNTASGSEAAFLRASNARRTQTRISLLVVAGLLLGLLIPAGLFVQQRAFPFTVSTLQDSGPGSLRQVIGTALPGSTISFAPGLKGSISLKTGLEITTNNVTIRGTGADVLSINGAGDANQPILISAGADVTFSDLTFSQTKSAIGTLFTNAGSLTLDKCTITNINMIGQYGSATVAAIYNTKGTLTIQNSSITKNTVRAESTNGSSINNNGGTVIIKNSKITDNTQQGSKTASGGAIVSSDGKVTLTNSVISGNTVTGPLEVNGGGIESINDTITLTNSIIANNSAHNIDPQGLGQGGGIDTTKSIVTLTNSRVTGNTIAARKGASGGGIAISGGSLTLTNSAILKNTVNGGDSTGPATGGGISGSLGPITLTNSQVASNTVTDDAETDGGGIYSSSGPIILTNSQVTNNTLTSNVGANGGGLNNTFGSITLTGSVISGNTITAPQVDGGGISDINGQLALTDTTVSNNTARDTQGGKQSGGGGGGISSLRSTITLTNSHVTNNTLTSKMTVFGGGIYNSNGSITLTGSTVTDNTITAPMVTGGGISNANGQLTLTNATVSNNTATGGQGTGYGGGISENGQLTITNSAILNNRLASSYPGSGGTAGGGIFMQGTLNLSNSTVAGNTVTDSNSNGVGIGAGILVLSLGDAKTDDTLKLTNCTISNNTASGGKGSYAGGIEAENIHGIIDFCTIYGNTASTKGGGLASALTTRGRPPPPPHRNTLIANNSAAKGPDTAGSITTDGYNLVQRFADTEWNGPANKHATDLSGDKFPNLGIDPHLHADGKATPTLALLPNSPLLNLIPASSCDMPVDQRGIKRPQQNACDIGAYEYAP